MVANLQTPFTDAQLELLKIFDKKLSDADMKELKDILLDFKFRKFQQIIEKDIVAKGYTSKQLEQMSEEHNRTPYESNRKIASREN